MRTSIFSLLMATLLACSAYAKGIERKVSIVAGEKLLKLALRNTLYKYSVFDDPPDHSSEIFLIYPILGATEGILTHFAINPWTGDVWDMNECRLLSNPQLLEAQVKIKKQFHGKELKEYD